MEKLPCCCGAGRIVFWGNERFPHVLAALAVGGLAHALDTLALDAGGLPHGFEASMVGCIGCIPFQLGCEFIAIPLFVGEVGLSGAKLLIIWSGVMAREAGPCCGLSTELIAEEGLVGHVGDVGLVVNARCPLPVLLPRTRRSKSSSPTPEDPKGSLEGRLVRPFERGLSNPLVEFEASSLSFLVCSCSILEDKALISVMYS